MFIAVLCFSGFFFVCVSCLTRIAKAANKGYPLSIVIVGVGDNDNFEFLQKLHNCEKTRLKYCKQVKICRNIVQFVKFGDFKNRYNFAKNALKEVSEQFMSFVAMHQVSLEML